jgi:hypothetical protein
MSNGILKSILIAGAALLILPGISQARDVDYKNQEVKIRVTPNEPTQIQFPGEIAGGFRRRDSSLSLDRKQSDLVIFSNEGISKRGEAIIVRLKDGRSYSLRVFRADDENGRDTIVSIRDERGSLITDSEEEDEPAHKERQFRYAKPTQVSGLMREMVLAMEFGKDKIPGYKTSDRFKGEPVLNDGTMKAEIEKIFIGPNLWGYVINTSNMLDQGQRLNPATFRLDGTRAVSASNWELAPRPMNIEQQIAGKHNARIYVITRAKKTR